MKRKFKVLTRTLWRVELTAGTSQAHNMFLDHVIAVEYFLKEARRLHEAYSGIDREWGRELQGFIHARDLDGIVESLDSLEVHLQLHRERVVTRRIEMKGWSVYILRKTSGKRFFASYATFAEAEKAAVEFKGHAYVDDESMPRAS